MRRTISLLILSGILSLTAPPAFAGGSWLAVVPENSDGAGGSGTWFVWGAPGGTLAMRAVGEDWAKGIYEVYLQASTGGDLIRVGSATTFQPERWVGGIRTTFPIPDVAPGEYTVLVCPPAYDVCSDVATQGWVTIAETPRLARLTVTAAMLRSQVRELRREASEQDDSLARVREHLERATARLERVSEDRAEMEQALENTTSQRDVALQQEREAHEQIAAARNETASWRLATYLILIVVVAGACLLLMRRRHYVRVRIPDSPRELLEPSSRPRERS